MLFVVLRKSRDSRVGLVKVFYNVHKDVTCRNINKKEDSENG